MKACSKCEEEKPLDDFYHKAAKCKECTKAAVRLNYRKNVAYYKDYEQRRANLPHRVAARERYALTDAGRTSITRSKKKWESSNPIKRNANTLVGNAVRDGRITKPSNCESCGDKPDRLNGHHDDYSKPLEVRWLCGKCHTAWHLENGEGKNGHIDDQKLSKQLNG